MISVITILRAVPNPQTAFAVAPVTRRSGNRCGVIVRPVCQVRLRSAVYGGARVTVERNGVSRHHLAKLNKPSHSHGRALRSVIAVVPKVTDRKNLLPNGGKSCPS